MLYAFVSFMAKDLDYSTHSYRMQSHDDYSGHNLNYFICFLVKLSLNNKKQRVCIKLAKSYKIVFIG